MITLEDLKQIQLAGGSLAYQAEAAIRWMTEEGVDKIPQIGPFGDRSVKVGDTVIIAAGSTVRSTGPKATYTTQRRQSVRITHVYDGYIDSHWHSHKRQSANRPQEIEWAGTGSYWCRTDSANIEEKVNA